MSRDGMLPEKYVALVLKKFPDKDAAWAQAQFERCYNNLECPRMPDDELIERVLETEFALAVMDEAGLVVLDLEEFSLCERCGAQIARIKGLPPEDICADCD